MLELKQIIKDYDSGNEVVHALRGITLSFRENEFVSILGQSGCGKTTLLNIVGGLDHYTSGDLVINGKSTKDFTDRDWDEYRNHSIGFVFQSYNLIPHQNVLSNVELALTLSGVSKEERRQRALSLIHISSGRSCAFARLSLRGLSLSSCRQQPGADGTRLGRTACFAGSRRRGVSQERNGRSVAVSMEGMTLLF